MIETTYMYTVQNCARVTLFFVSEIFIIIMFIQYDKCKKLSQKLILFSYFDSDICEYRVEFGSDINGPRERLDPDLQHFFKYIFLLGFSHF